MFNNIQEALVQVNILCNQPAVAGDRADFVANIVTDVHKYTATLIRQGYPQLVAADEQFIHSAQNALSFEILFGKLMQHADMIDYPQAQKDILFDILTKIQIFVQAETGGLENQESMVSIPDILLRCYNLSMMGGTQDIVFASLTEILFALDGNLIDAGGCMPGVVGRLYPIYARLLTARLETVNLEQFLQSSTSAAQAYEEEEEKFDDGDQALRAALEASNLEARRLADQAAREQADLDLVLQMSRLSSQASTASQQGFTPTYSARASLAAVLSDISTNFLNEYGFSLSVADLDKRTSRIHEWRLYTPLTLAALKANDGACGYLLADGALVNAQNGVGNTVLHMLTYITFGPETFLGARVVGLAKLFLSKGADLNIRNHRGETPIQIVKNDTLAAIYHDHLLNFAPVNRPS